MTSAIDPAVIRDDQKVAKSDLRNQLTIAANEITALQKETNKARMQAFDTTPDINGLLAVVSSIQATVTIVNRRTSYAYELAFGTGDKI